MTRLFLLSLTLAGGAALTTQTTPLLTTAQDQVTYQAGQNTFSGITTITLKGTGEVSVTRTKGRSKEQYSGTATAGQLKLVNSALAGAFTHQQTTATTYRPTADEARIKVDVRTPRGTQTLKFWQNQAAQNETFKALMTAFQNVASAVSNGKITY